MIRLSRFLLPAILLACSTTALSAQTCRFDFGASAPAEGYIPVSSLTRYSDALGYGFEPGTTLT